MFCLTRGGKGLTAHVHEAGVYALIRRVQYLNVRGSLA